MFTRKLNRNSHAIDLIAYDHVRRVLQVHFKNQDEEHFYEYQGVPISVYAKFPAGHGAGSYFTENIRGRYNYKIRPGEEFATD